MNATNPPDVGTLLAFSVVGHLCLRRGGMSCPIMSQAPSVYDMSAFKVGNPDEVAAAYKLHTHINTHNNRPHRSLAG